MKWVVEAISRSDFVTWKHKNFVAFTNKETGHVNWRKIHKPRGQDFRVFIHSEQFWPISLADFKAIFNLLLSTWFMNASLRWIPFGSMPQIQFWSKMWPLPRTLFQITWKNWSTILWLLFLLSRIFFKSLKIWIKVPPQLSWVVITKPYTLNLDFFQYLLH